MKSKQEKLANSFVQDVPKFGWSRETLLQCAKKLKISTPNLALLFPSFEYDVLKFLIAQNNALVEKNYNSFNNSRLKVRDKIKTILELKFESNAFLKKALPLTLITAVLYLVSIYSLNNFFELNNAIYKVIFIGLASLTFPHILLEYLIEKNEE